MKFENTKVMNFNNALRGMRNPKNSWDRSDSFFGIIDTDFSNCDYEVATKWMEKYYPELYKEHLDHESSEYEKKLESYVKMLLDEGILSADDSSNYKEVAFIGPNDMKLAQSLVASGPEHRKFLRQIFVSVDITAPLYWWKEADTYKIGTTTNSTSTMHKITSKPITIDCFETDDYDGNLDIFDGQMPYTRLSVNDEVECIISFCEELRQKYLKTKDKRYWKELIRWLPESWLQTRTWTADYETILSMYKQRQHHKLGEWSHFEPDSQYSFCQWAIQLPYMYYFVFCEDSLLVERVLHNNY